MASFNRVILVGNITRDPQVRYTPSGTAVADFGLAVNRKYRSSDGEAKEEVCFIDISAWGRQAEVISEYTSKGDPILIEGRLQQQSWQGQDGQKRTKHQVVVENFQFLGRRGEGQGNEGGAQRRQAPPRGPAPRTPAPEDDQQAPMDDPLAGDDIPF